VRRILARQSNTSLEPTPSASPNVAASPFFFPPFIRRTGGCCSAPSLDAPTETSLSRDRGRPVPLLGVFEVKEQGDKARNLTNLELEGDSIEDPLVAVSGCLRLSIFACYYLYEPSNELGYLLWLPVCASALQLVGIFNNCWEASAKTK